VVFANVLCTDGGHRLSIETGASGSYAQQSVVSQFVTVDEAGLVIFWVTSEKGLGFLDTAGEFLCLVDRSLGCYEQDQRKGCELLGSCTHLLRYAFAMSSTLRREPAWLSGVLSRFSVSLHPLQAVLAVGQKTCSGLPGAAWCWYRPGRSTHTATRCTAASVWGPAGQPSKVSNTGCCVEE
jgi:hypothetical protein